MLQTSSSKPTALQTLTSTFWPAYGFSLAISRSLFLPYNNSGLGASSINSVSSRVSRIVADKKVAIPKNASSATPATTRKLPICFLGGRLNRLVPNVLPKFNCLVCGSPNGQISRLSYSRNKPTKTINVDANVARLKPINTEFMASTSSSRPAIDAADIIDHKRAVKFVVLAWFVTALICIALMVIAAIRWK